MFNIKTDLIKIFRFDKCQLFKYIRQLMKRKNLFFWHYISVKEIFRSWY